MNGLEFFLVQFIMSMKVYFVLTLFINVLTLKGNNSKRQQFNRVVPPISNKMANLREIKHRQETFMEYFCADTGVRTISLLL